MKKQDKKMLVIGAVIFSILVFGAVALSVSRVFEKIDIVR